MTDDLEFGDGTQISTAEVANYPTSFPVNDNAMCMSSTGFTSCSPAGAVYAVACAEK